ncbi:hypothetical protein CBS101457_005930 [Exobasidium rhododendri]|nr:hypothetical protein CBS101457_005930 [Exobasidium rhododendri]
MLSRTLQVRRDGRGLYARALSSSSRSLAGIAIGGTPNSSSSSPSTSSRFSLSALKDRVKSETPRDSPAPTPSPIFSSPQHQQQSFRHNNPSQESHKKPEIASGRPFEDRFQGSDVRLPSERRSTFAALRSRVQPSGPNDPSRLSSGNNDRWANSNRLQANQNAIEDRASGEITNALHQRKEAGRGETHGSHQANEQDTDGWAAGLREKIEKARDEEQRLQASEQRAQRSEPYESEAKEHVLTGTMRDVDHVGDVHQNSAGNWLPFVLNQPQSEQCKVQGLESWVEFSKQDQNTQRWSLLLGRRISFNTSSAALQCLSSVANYAGKTSHLKHLSYTSNLIRRTERSNKGYLQIEVGGLHTSKGDGTAKGKGKPRLSHTSSEAVIALQITRLIDTFLALDEGSAIDAEAAIKGRMKAEEGRGAFQTPGSREGRGAREGSSSSSSSGPPQGYQHARGSTMEVEFANERDLEGRNQNGRNTIISSLGSDRGTSQNPISASPQSKKPTRDAKIEESRGRDETPTKTSLAERLQSLSRHRVGSEYNKPFPSLSTMEGGKGRKDVGGRSGGTTVDSSSTSIKDQSPSPKQPEKALKSNDASSSRSPTTNEHDTPTADKDVSSRFEGTDDFFTSSGTHEIEEATPVHVDGVQPKGVGSTPGLNGDADEGARKQIKDANHDDERDPSSHSSSRSGSNAVDEATPVHIDDQQAKGESLKGKTGQGPSTTSIGGIVGQSSEPKRRADLYTVEEDLPSESNSDGSDTALPATASEAGGYFDGIDDLFSSSTSHEVSDATPISIDGEQAQKRGPTSGVEEHSEGEASTLPEKDGDGVSSSSPPASTNAVDEATPVLIDGEQGKGPAPDK